MRHLLYCTLCFQQSTKPCVVESTLLSTPMKPMANVTLFMCREINKQLETSHMYILIYDLGKVV